MSGNEAPQHEQKNGLSMPGDEAPHFEAAQQAAPEIEPVHVDLESGEMNKTDKPPGGKCDKKGKKSSKAWDFFDELVGCPEGSEKAKCKL